MNVTEMRLFVLGLQGVRPHIKDNSVYDLEFHETIIPTNQLMDLLGRNYGSIANLKDQLEKAYDSKITLNYKNGGFEFKHIYDIMKYEPEQGLIIKFDNKMKPYILEIVGQQYTKYKVKALFTLSSAYAWRILELLFTKQGYFKKGYHQVYIEYEIGKLREVLNVGEDMYKKTTDFRMYVLDRPIKEINEKTDYFVWYTIEKAGRRIKKFTIYLKLKEIETDKKEIASPPQTDSQSQPPQLTAIVTSAQTGKQVEQAPQPPPNDLPISAPTPGIRLLQAVGLNPPSSVIKRAMETATEPTKPTLNTLDNNMSMKPQEENVTTSASAPAEENTEEKKHWSDQQQADYDLMLQHGVWVPMARKFVTTYDHARIERSIKGVLQTNPKGNIRDKGAVIAHAIAHDTFKDEAEEKAKARERAEERKISEAIKAEKECKKSAEQKEKNVIKNEELARIRVNKSKKELVETFEKVLVGYKNNNNTLNDEMRVELAANGIPETDFSLYQSETMRSLIKYLK